MPVTFVSDNGTEFTLTVILPSCHRTTKDRHYVAPGKPMPYGVIESLSSRFRDGFLNGVLFSTLTDARTRIATSTKDNNRHRPHAALGNIPLTGFSLKLRLEMLAAETRKSSRWFSPTPEEKRGSA